MGTQVEEEGEQTCLLFPTWCKRYERSHMASTSDRSVRMASLKQ